LFWIVGFDIQLSLVSYLFCSVVVRGLLVGGLGFGFFFVTLVVCGVGWVRWFSGLVLAVCVLFLLVIVVFFFVYVWLVLGRFFQVCCSGLRAYFVWFCCWCLYCLRC